MKEEIDTQDDGSCLSALIAIFMALVFLLACYAIFTIRSDVHAIAVKLDAIETEGE